MSKQAVNKTKGSKSKADIGSIQEMERLEQIAHEAYLRAEQRGFDGGDPVADWLEAEENVDFINKMNL